MDRELELHKALSQAQVEHQQKFDALKNFDDNILQSGQITNIENQFKERKRLELEEQIAKEKVDIAQRNYNDYKQQYKAKSG